MPALVLPDIAGVIYAPNVARFQINLHLNNLLLQQLQVQANLTMPAKLAPTARSRPLQKICFCSTSDALWPMVYAWHLLAPVTFVVAQH